MKIKERFLIILLQFILLINCNSNQMKNKDMLGTKRFLNLRHFSKKQPMRFTTGIWTINKNIKADHEFSSFKLNFLKEPKNDIKEGLEHYTEKIDSFFKYERKGRNIITVKEFENIFHEAEKKYFKDLPKLVMSITEMLASKEVRMLYIMNRWTLNGSYL